MIMEGYAAVGQYVYMYPPSVHHELDVMGQDGHVYKGRMSSRNKLPRLKVSPPPSSPSLSIPLSKSVFPHTQNRTSNYQ